tara:strand:- start:1080 stop:1583 length:504 start_codon:yes stop_codon:yes gene_type:complete
MNDDLLRALERRWQETGSDEDELAWDQERSRRGLPLRVIAVAMTVRTFEPHLESEATRRDHKGMEKWELVVDDVLRRRYAPWLVVDLSAATYFHEALACVLIEGLSRLKEAGGGFALCGVPVPIRMVLDSLGLRKLFSFSESVATCLAERGWAQRGQALSVELLAET